MPKIIRRLPDEPRQVKPKTRPSAKPNKPKSKPKLKIKSNKPNIKKIPFKPPMIKKPETPDDWLGVINPLALTFIVFGVINWLIQMYNDPLSSNYLKLLGFVSTFKPAYALLIALASLILATGYIGLWSLPIASIFISYAVSVNIRHTPIIYILCFIIAAGFLGYAVFLIRKHRHD